MEKNENKKKNILTGPSMGYSDIFPQRETWEEIAKETNGEFKIRLTESSENEIHHLSIPYNKWKIELSVSDTRPMKFHVAFDSRQAFELNISWEDIFDKISKKFGASDTEVGSREFDKNYLVKTDKPHVAKEIISKEVQECFLKYNVYSLSYHSDPDKASAELNSVIQKVPGNKEMVLELISVFKLLADNLQKARIVK